MNPIIEEYIQKNSLTKAPNIEIFKDHEEFLCLLYSNNEKVHMIVWYEYCKQGQQQIGLGGFAARENPDYMFAELKELYEIFPEETTLDEILEYISKTKKEYSQYEIYPEFYIAE